MHALRTFLLVTLSLFPALFPIMATGDKPSPITADHGTNVREVICPNGVAITKFWARAATGANSAVYFRIKAVKHNIHLTHAQTPVADRVEIHKHVDHGGRIVMEKVVDFHMKAGTEYVFQPGDMHLMLMGLRQELHDHNMLPLTLTFDDQTRCKIFVPVELRQPY